MDYGCKGFRMRRRKFFMVLLGTFTITGMIGSVRFWREIFGESISPVKFKFNESKVSSSTKGNHFFSSHQYATIAVLSAHIVPSDDTPGATEANVVEFIDRKITNSAKKQKKYLEGLDRLDKFCHNRSGGNFLSLSSNEQLQIIDEIFISYETRRQKVSNPISRVKHKIFRLWDDMFSVGSHVAFFAMLRRDVFKGFYSHPVSWEVLGYSGPPQPLGYPDYSNPPKLFSVVSK